MRKLENTQVVTRNNSPLDGSTILPIIALRNNDFLGEEASQHNMMNITDKRRTLPLPFRRMQLRISDLLPVSGTSG